MSNNIALTRLTEERKNWRKDHPFGFVAKPITKADGSADMMNWECLIPGKEGSIWAGGVYKILLKFSESYPMSPPSVVFVPPLPHINVFSSGAVCLSIVSYDWKPSISIKQILLGVQTLMDEPNVKSVANQNIYHSYTQDRRLYEANARKFAASQKPQV